MFDDGKLQIEEEHDEYAAHKDDVYVLHASYETVGEIRISPSPPYAVRGCTALLVSA